VSPVRYPTKSVFALCFLEVYDKNKFLGRRAISRATMLFLRRVYSGRYSEPYTAKTLFALYYIKALRKDVPYCRVERGGVPVDRKAHRMTRRAGLAFSDFFKLVVLKMGRTGRPIS
jgi:hypothetical protein